MPPAHLTDPSHLPHLLLTTRPPASSCLLCCVLQVQSVSASLSPELQQEVIDEARKQAVQSGAATAKLLAQASELREKGGGRGWGRGAEGAVEAGGPSGGLLRQPRGSVLRLACLPASTDRPPPDTAPLS